MIVILVKDVKNLGKAGDVVKVNDGYGRNMLLPKGLAKEATDGNIKSLEKQKALMEKKKESDLGKAKELADQIGTYKVTIKSKSGEGGRLFGSITSQDISTALEEQHDVHIDKKKIVLEAPIKEAGKHVVDIKVYPEVSAKLKVNVEV